MSGVDPNEEGKFQESGSGVGLPAKEPGFKLGT